MPIGKSLFDKNGAELAPSLSQPVSLFLYLFLESGARSVDRRFFFKRFSFFCSRHADWQVPVRQERRRARALAHGEGQGQGSRDCAACGLGLRPGILQRPGD